MQKMANKLNVSHKPTKPSKLVALIALLAVVFILVIAMLLPYTINKIFHRAPTEYTRVNLPEKPKPSVLQPIYGNEQLADSDVDSDSDDEDEPESEWQTITTRSGDTMASVFKRAGLSGKTLQDVLYKNPHAKAISTLKTNQPIEFLIRDETLEQLVMPISATQYIVVTLKDKKYITELKTRKIDHRNQYVTAKIRGSLYSTAKRANIPYKLIQQMTETLKWEIDFSREVKAGDQFTIVYNASFIDNNLVGVGEIIAVTYTSRGKTHHAIRHTNSDGDSEYFTADGKSFRKAFVRYPIKFSHISSTFSMSRKHPILHYNRPHKGIDLAASLGTPIRATGDGRIATIGHENGYGNMIKIKHDGNYSSIYGHMLKFQKGLSKGDKVKRGQIIGYVGQSGLATGPHCHYEFHVNNHPRNPTTVDIPLASGIPAREFAKFKANSNALLAQMKLFEQGKFADANKVTSKG